MATRKPIDWERVEADYCAGVKSIREIARENGVTDTGVRDKAKKAGWVRTDRTKERQVAPKLCSDEYSKAGFLYVIFIEDSNGKRFFKIGITENFGARIVTHQCSSPFDMRVACAYFVGNMRREETYLHDVFSGNRVRGEWFDLSDEDVAMISSRSKLT